MKDADVRGFDEKTKVGGYMNETQLDQYLDLQSLVNRYPQFKEGQLRWFVVRKKELGLEQAIKRLGRRLYFHVPTFLKWIDEQKA